MFVVLPVIFLLCGLGLIWVAKHYDLQLGEISRTVLILLPVLFYLILSGKLAELEVTGLKAKFRDIASEKVIDTARATELAISALEANEPNFFLDVMFQQCRPYYVISAKTARKDGKLEREAVLNIAGSIRAAMVCGKFKGLVVVTETKTPIGMFARDQFLELARIPLVLYGAGKIVDSNKVYDDVMSSELGVVISSPEERAKSDEAYKVIVKWNESLDKVYKELIDGGFDTAMIVDRFGRFDGIITRSAIESRVIGKLMEAAR
jgi:CBS domain-containing protein